MFARLIKVVTLKMWRKRERCHAITHVEGETGRAAETVREKGRDRR